MNIPKPLGRRLEYLLNLDDYKDHEMQVGAMIRELYVARYDGWATQLMTKVFYPKKKE